MNLDLDLIGLAARQDHLVDRADVERLGFTSGQWCRRVDRAEWKEVAPGVWCHAAVPITWELRVRAGARWLGPRAALFGCSDAAWWGLDGFGPGPVEFVTPRVRRGLDPRFTLHTTLKWDPRDLLMHRGVRCTSVTRAVIDMAGQGEPPRRLESAIDSGVRMRLTSVPTLTARMRTLSATRLPGLPLLRALLLDSGGESFLERRFLRVVREAGLPRPLTQVVHRRPDGPVSRVDFEFTRARLIVEVSGRLGHTSDTDRQRDARRRNALQRQRAFLEFTTADVLDDPSYVIATLLPYLTPASVGR